MRIYWFPRLDKEEKKATKNATNRDEKSFQYGVMVALNYVQIQSHTGRVQNITRFLKKYNKMK